MTPPDQETVYRRWLQDHWGLLLKIVRAKATTTQDQEDLLQEILLNLWTLLGSFRGESRETTWIYRVACNTAWDWKRSDKRRQRRERAWMKQLPPTPLTNPQNATINHEAIERLYAAIRQLPHVEAALALMHLDGLSYREMAEVVGISENYVGVKLTRIRHELAAQLTGGQDELR